MSSSEPNKPQNPEPITTADHSKPVDPKNPDQEPPTAEQIQNQENEDEGECGLCLFMKGGACKQVFIDWENCIEEGEKKKEDVVEKCFKVTSALMVCMEVNSDYYGPYVQALKAAEQEAVKQLNKEKEEKQKQKPVSS